MKIINIIHKLKIHSKLKDDKDVAKLIGISNTAFCNHKARNTIPYKNLMAYCDKTGVSLDWLFYGDVGDSPLRGARQDHAQTASVTRLVRPEDAPKEELKQWIDEYWLTADRDERGWLIVEMKRNFPTFNLWLAEKKHGEGDLAVGQKTA